MSIIIRMHGFTWIKNRDNKYLQYLYKATNGLGDPKK